MTGLTRKVSAGNTSDGKRATNSPSFRIKDKNVSQQTSQDGDVTKKREAQGSRLQLSYLKTLTSFISYLSSFALQQVLSNFSEVDVRHFLFFFFLNRGLKVRNQCYRIKPNVCYDVSPTSTVVVVTVAKQLHPGTPTEPLTSNQIWLVLKSQPITALSVWNGGGPTFSTCISPPHSPG